MSRVNCSVDYTSELNDRGFDAECVIVTCSRCGHDTQSWGHGDGSVKRCLVLLNEECPAGENNFYVEG